MLDDDDLLREIIDPKLDMTSAEFNPKDYLASKHAMTKFSVLVETLQTLKRSTSDKTEQLKSLVASHFDEYLSCHEAIREVAEEIRAHESDNELLTSAYQKLKRNTDASLSLMLRRCEEQRKINHAMAVLHRFRSLFEVPARLRELLKTKEYLKLVEEYLLLKANVSKANLHSILKPVFDAAHATTMQANAELVQQIESPSHSLGVYNDAIRAMELLDITPKPSLVCVKHQFAWMEKGLAQCVVPTENELSRAGGKLKLKASTSTVGNTSNVATLQRTPQEIVQTCESIVNAFDRCVWSLVCDTMKCSALTAFEQEGLHTTVHSILSTTIKYFEENSMSLCSQPFLQSMHSLFVQFDSFKPCPDPVLNTKLQALKQRFCCQLRQELVLTFISNKTKAMEESWIELHEGNHSKWLKNIQELPTQIQVGGNQPGVLTSVAKAWLDKMLVWWSEVDGVIATALQVNTSDTEEVHQNEFCAILLETLGNSCGALLSLYADGLHQLITEPPSSHGSLVGLTNAIHFNMSIRAIIKGRLEQKQFDEALQPVELLKEQCFSQYMASRIASLDAMLRTEEITTHGKNESPEDQEDDDSRQYIFSLLLLMVSWRHEIEATLPGSLYVNQMLQQVMEYIVRSMETRVEVEINTSMSWCLTHLHVELKYFCKHMKKWIPHVNAIENGTLKRLENKTRHELVEEMLSQLELQTRMYRLCLSA